MTQRRTAPHDPARSSGTLHRPPSRKPSPQLRRVHIEQEADIFEIEWSMTRRAKQPFPGFIEFTSAAVVRRVGVGLKDVHGIDQNGKGQPPKGLHPLVAPASGKELSGQDGEIMEDAWFKDLFHLVVPH